MQIISPAHAAAIDAKQSSMLLGAPFYVAALLLAFALVACTRAMRA